MCITKRPDMTVGKTEAGRCAASPLQWLNSGEADVLCKGVKYIVPYIIDHYELIS